MPTKAARLKPVTSSGTVAERSQTERRRSGKTAFTKRQYTIAVEGLRSEGLARSWLGASPFRCLSGPAHPPKQ
jgi:hypothetical protein